MLKIKLASYTADLDDQQISIVMTSPYPLMATGIDGGNYIYNFTLPATPALKKVFKHAHRPAAVGLSGKVPFSIDASGIRYSGEAILTEGGDDTYEVQCQVANGSFNMQTKQVKLPAIDFGGVINDPVLPLIADCGVNIFLDDAKATDFTITQNIPFSLPISNAGEMSADGFTFTATKARDVSLMIQLTATFNTGSYNIELHKNGLAVETWLNVWHGDMLNFDLTLAVGNTLTFKIVAYAENVNESLYVVNGTLYAATRLTIGSPKQNFTMLEGATKRYPEVSFAVFPVENPRVFDNWPDDNFSVDNQSLKTMYSEYFKVINYWHGGTFPATMSTNVNGEVFSAGNLFVPFPYLAFIVKRIANYFGFRIINNVFDDELKYAVLINFFIENSFFTNDATLMTPNDSFRMNDHVPDWTVYEFLQNINNLFGLGYEIDDELQTITFAFVRDVFTSNEYVDISHLIVSKPRADWNSEIKAYALKQDFPDTDALKDEIKTLEGLTLKGSVLFLGDLPVSGNKVNDCYYVSFSYAFFAWQYDPEIYQFAWMLHSRNHTIEILSGIDPAEIVTQLPAAINQWNAVIGVKTWMIPASYQQGIFEGAPDAYKSQWKPLVVWYHGLKLDSGGNTYPFASAEAVDKNNQPITDVPFSLKLKGIKNIYDSQWKDYLNWRVNAKMVKVNIIPDRKFLRTFIFSKKVRFGGVNYLVVQMRGNIGKNGPDVWELLLLVV